jgi:hypothetical protein
VEARFHVPDVLRHVGLDAALQGLQALAEAELQASDVPPLYASGVRYVREPRGHERWLPPSVVLSRGQGDCEDLAAYRAAELRITGEDPDAEARVVRTGPRTWHAVVLRGDGDWEDPSAALGMSIGRGLIAPFRFRLEPNGPRDYRARIDLSGGGWADSYYASGEDPADALWRCTECAAAHEMGQLPFIQPFLDIASQVAQQALRPPAMPTAPRLPAPPSRQAPSGESLDDALISLARQLQTVTRREVNRRLARERARARR